jgi:hypothetical protein
VATLANYGLTVTDTVYKPDIARDVVLEINFSGHPLEPGTLIPKGSRLGLVLGDGEGNSEVAIPDLINLDLDAAKFAIKGAGLVIGAITYQGAITDSANLVVTAQIPAKTDSASTTNRGTPVNLTVIQGSSTNEPH